jgi:ubiquinone/menaquinone biosynthesis C-methylase UbiE
MNSMSFARYICPYCKKKLSFGNQEKTSSRILLCEEHHSFETEGEIPILLRNEDRAQRYVNSAFLELARTYEKTVSFEFDKYWGMKFEDFIERVGRAVLETRPRNLLDVATGIGKIPEFLLKRGMSDIGITAIDITVPMLEAASARLKELGLSGGATLVCASGEHLPFPDESFDTVVCALGGHHMDPRSFMLEAHRVLEKKGRIIVSDAVTSDFFRSFAGRVLLEVLLLQYLVTGNPSMIKVERDAFSRMRTISEWREIFVATGFGNIEAEAIAPRRSIYPGGMIVRGERL